MRKMRAKVWRLRTASDLFSIQTYTRGLESVYEKMWERYENGEDVGHLTDLALPCS